MRKLLNTFADRPRWVTIAATLLVLLHAGLSLAWPHLSPWGGLVAQSSNDIVAVYLGFAGITAIVSGFAGVVSVFGLSSSSHAFRLFRREAGGSLIANWLTPTIESLLAALLSVVASLLVYSNLTSWSTWAFELALLLAVHGALRLVWLFAQLTKLVSADDKQVLHDEEQRAIEKMLDW